MDEHSNLPETVDYHPTPSVARPRWKQRLEIVLPGMVVFLGMSVGFLGGYASSRQAGTLDVSRSAAGAPAPRLPTRVGWSGILVIEDSTARTVTKNRAALGSRDGFTALDYGRYPVIAYVVAKDEEFGVGVAGDPEATCFPFIWRKGATLPPRTLRALEIPGGRQVLPVSQ